MFSNFKISTKLFISFLFILLLTVFLGTFSVVQISRLNTITKDIATTQVPAIKSIKDIDSLVGSYRRSELLMVLASEQQDIQKYVNRAEDAAAKLKTELVVTEKLIGMDEERKTFAEFKKALGAWMAEHPKIVEQALLDNDEEATKLIMGASSKHFNAAIKALEECVASTIKQTQDKSKRCFNINSSAQLWILISLIACLIIGLLLAIVISRMISRPIGDMARQAQRVADGELNVRINQDSNDEIGQLSASFNKMVESLRDVISKVVATSGQVTNAADQLRATSEQMSTGAEQVVAQASTVATASEEMAATSGDIAQNCAMAANSSRDANNAALAGAEVIQATVTGMSRIAERVKGTAVTVEGLGARSDQIGAIVGTIEDIADQTNLLALNAAIEAARAGEQGRGFAVVADEVRALAERTTRATKEISDMIKAIQQETRSAVTAMEEGVREVARGTEDAARSGAALQEILDQINSVTSQVNQIATAAEEQTATTNQISSNILQINDVVHVTARGAQESASASAKLASLAEDLQAIVGRFHL